MKKLNKIIEGKKRMLTHLIESSANPRVVDKPKDLDELAEKAFNRLPTGYRDYIRLKIETHTLENFEQFLNN